MFGREREYKREIPIGTGRKSESKETLPAVEVDNEVVWVNEDFPEAPFKLEKGKPTKLGPFLTQYPKADEKIFNLRVEKKHWRSGLLDRVIFKDRQGRFYRDLDLKGVGHIVCPGDKYYVARIEQRYDQKTASGIFNLDYARYAKDWSEKFLKAGIRTERYLAIIKLKELVDESGNKISIKEAKKRGLLYPKQEPAIVLRALGSKFRLLDIEQLVVSSPADIKNRLEDARCLVAQELGIKEENFSFDDYLNWFAETAGKNLGLMHKNGWHHRFLTGHNITLDCRIVDLDSVNKFSLTRKQSEMKEDYADLCDTLEGFFREWGPSSLRDSAQQSMGSLINKFSQSYIKNLGYAPKFYSLDKILIHS